MSRQMDIVRASLCISSPIDNRNSCIGAVCPYYVEEMLSEDDAKRYGTAKIESCNVDQIGLDAAWELLRLMEERTTLKSAIKYLEEVRNSLESERDALLDDAAQSGGCELCANNGYEKTYPDCTGCCSACSHKECPCSGCENMSKWIWAGPIHGE